MIHFVTEKFLKTYGVITDNVDVTDFSPLVKSASIAFIRPMLGTVFFNDLLAKYNDQTLSADEETLVAKMQFAISWRMMAEAGVTLTYQLKNKGYQTQSGENSDAVADDVVWKLYTHYNQKAFVFQDEIKTYLKENKDLYPVFMSEANNDSSIKDTCNGQGPTFNEGIGMILI